MDGPLGQMADLILNVWNHVEDFPKPFMVWLQELLSLFLRVLGL